MSETQPNPNYTTEELVARYVELRDDIAAKSEEFKAAKAALEESMTILNDELFLRLKAAGGTSLKTRAGSVISKTTTTPKAADTGVFLEFIRTTGAVELLQARLSATAVNEWIENNNGALPPGVIQETSHSITIRRA